MKSRIIVLLAVCIRLYSLELIDTAKLSSIAHSTVVKTLIAAPSAYYVTNQLEENIFCQNSIAPVLQQILPSNGRTLIITSCLLITNIFLLRLVQSHLWMVPPTSAAIVICSIHKGNKKVIAANVGLAAGLLMSLL